MRWGGGRWKKHLHPDGSLGVRGLRYRGIPDEHPVVGHLVVPIKGSHHGPGRVHWYVPDDLCRALMRSKQEIVRELMGAIR